MDITHQNPKNPAPLHILEELVSLNIKHTNFDGELCDGTILVHKNLASDVEEFFALALSLQFPIESVIPICDPRFAWDDETSCNQNNSSGFNYRHIMGSDELSKHSYGWAFDINPRQNIYVRFDTDGNEIYRLPADGLYNETAPGTLTANHSLVLLMKENGWTWGGDWSPANGRIDYQHFEKVAL